MEALTPSVLRAATCSTAARAAAWCEPIALACAIFAIDTPERMAAFLAQIGHESARLAHARELWGPTPAQRRYEGRSDLGNVHPGDGFRYRGRGLIQTTGRANYAATRDGLREFAPGAPDFEAYPELLEQPRWAALSAGWYWHRHGLNALADGADDAAFELITRRINGGTNGLDDRRLLWAYAKKALGVTP